MVQNPLVKKIRIVGYDNRNDDAKNTSVRCVLG